MLFRKVGSEFGLLWSLCLAASVIFGQAAFADEYFDQGVKLYNKRNFKGAAPYLENAMRNSPWDSNAYYYLALTYHQLGDWARAKHMYGQIIERFPDTSASQLAEQALQRLDPNLLKKLKAKGSSGSSSTAGAATTVQTEARSADFDSLPAEGRIYFTRQGNIEMVEAQVNGRGIQMVYDTGASQCVFGKNHLQELGINPPTGKATGKASGVGSSVPIEVWTMPLTLKVGNIVRRNLSVMVQDNLPTSPLLGETFFGDLEHTTDGGASCIQFKKKSSMARGAAPGQDRYSVPFVREGNELIVTVEINGKPFPMFFDTGADGITFAPQHLKRLNIEIPEDAEEQVHTGVGGETKAAAFTVKRMKMGPIEKYEVPVSCVEKSNMPHPLLGQTFYKDWQYTVDNQNKCIRFVRR